MASGDVNIVPFGESILTFRRSDGKSHGVVAVSGIGVNGILLCACLNAKYKLEILPDAGHDYSEDGAWERMAGIFVEWFLKEL